MQARPFISLTRTTGRAGDRRGTAGSTGAGRCWWETPDTDDVVLVSPIILYDHPRSRAESPGDLFDATEIDEILTLRIMTLTDDEKEEARATDPRAAALVDRVDTMPARRTWRGFTAHVREPPSGARQAPAPGDEADCPGGIPLRTPR